MTYLELYENALRDLEHSKITLGEFEERIKPLKQEIKIGGWIHLGKVKQAREEISDWDVNKVMDGCSEPFKLGVAKGLDIASVILDKLIESEDK